jgi:CubicO group peptidase (beta-lactamase class C family)
MIGSVTKPLTSLMMAVLVERGLLRWSTPLRELLPGFRFADAELTAKVDLRHSVCACTGLPRQDLETIFEYASDSPEKRLARLATIKPTTGFGGTFQYSNDLVAAGGFAAAHARWPQRPLLDAYAATMQETVFDPVGMTSTFFGNRIAAGGNYARPHGVGIDGHYAELPLAYEDFVNAIAPAGGAWSTVGDLARYLQLELARGRLADGARLLSEDGLLERRKPGIQIGPHSAYGLALVVTEDDGLRSAGHDGGTFGFSALVKFWPEHDLGLVVLSNAQAAHDFAGAVQRRLLELVLGIDEEAGKQLAYRVKRRDERIARELARITQPPEHAWIAPLVGEYENDDLGRLTLRPQGTSYRVDVGEWQSRVAEYTRAGQSTLLLVDPPAAGLKLQARAAGGLLLDAGQQKYVFRRTGPAQ